MTELIHGSVYDYPKYYDVLFNADWREEFEFLEACFERYAKRTVRRLFEPACGTGRLLYRLAKSGYEVSGLDLNRKAIDYCNARLSRHGFAESVIVADMCDFRLPKRQDAAFNTINSFRHLQTERSAVAHLQCMADCLAQGGLYLLGFHLTPVGQAVCESESWHARRGTLTIDSKMWIEQIDRRRRQEHIAFELDINTPTKETRIVDRFTFRTYSHAQFLRVLDQVKSLELVETFDFSYDISQPVCIDRSTEDIIYVLRRL